jgi:Glycosyltransferases involved in cell wall biogenesis
MKISVALCTYNGEKYIEEQLNSILTQHYTIDEIQIGDDGSTDNTINIINRLKKRFKEIYLTINPERLGIVKNFENTIKRCSGDYICLSDQDDIWHSNKLEVIIPVLERNPKIKACFTNASLIDEKGNKIVGSLWESFGAKKGSECLLSTERLFEYLLRLGNIATGATMVLKSERIKSLLPFRQRYDYEFHDLLIARSLAMNKEIIPIDEELIDYRLHKNQQASTFNEKYWAELFFLKKNILLKEFKNIGYQKVLYLAWNYYKNSINEIWANQDKANFSLKKYYIESKNEWQNIKRQTWSQYDCINCDGEIQKNKNERRTTLCYFVCYTEKEIEETDLKYINELKHHFDEVVVLTNYKFPIENLDCEYLFLENKGYDFGFLYQAINGKDLSKYSFIAFVNNSNILLENKTLIDFFSWLDLQDSKFCGMTDSFQKAFSIEMADSYHLQSHFLIFKDEAIDLLRNFFLAVRFERFFDIKDKKILREAIIIECEIGLSQYMIRNNIMPASWFKTTEFSEDYKIPLDEINVHTMFWKELIEEGYPLIKKKIACREFGDNLNIPI